MLEDNSILNKSVINPTKQFFFFDFLKVHNELETIKNLT